MQYRNTLAAALVGAAVGGAAVALATRAIPRLVERTLAAGMQAMAARMQAQGCDPAAI
jgi:hypothetical protein